MRKNNISTWTIIIISFFLTIIISFLIIKNKESKETAVVKSENNDFVSQKNGSSSALPETSNNEQSQNLKNSQLFNNQGNNNLKLIIEKIKTTAETRQLPLDKLSISLLDLNTGNYAFYQDDQPRYPASMVKLFWLVLFYEYCNKNISCTDDIAEEISKEKLLKFVDVSDQAEFEQYDSKAITNKVLEKMIQDSDNETASFIVDKITDTRSSKTVLSEEDFINWKDKRYSINNFFIQQGYPQQIELFNISQKTFPIPYLKFESPEGPELQIRQLNGVNSPPIRNKLTSQSMTKLMYDIYTGNIISPELKNKIWQLLNRDIDSLRWKSEDYDSIEYFLGEGLQGEKVQFFSKMGWTFNNRNDAAIIISPDQKTKYILVVFGDDAKFYQDQKFLPIISKIVYEDMTKNSN